MILLAGPTIYNIQYCWLGPAYPYYICDITGWAHHIQYTILLAGPTIPILYMRYCWLGPAYLYYIYDITCWAQHIPYTILLAGPIIPYYICDIAGWAQPTYIIYTILLGGPSIYNIRYCWLGPAYPYCIYDITGWAHHIQYTIL